MPHEVPDEVGIAVDRFGGLDQRTFAGLIETAHPDQESLQVNEEDAGGFLQRPASGRSELQDPHALGGRVVRSATGAGPLPSAILDRQFFPQQSDLGVRLLELGAEPTTAGGPAAGIGQDDTGKRDGVENPRLDVPGPRFRESNRRASGHGKLRSRRGGLGA